jgi:hypothetical protein
MAKGFSVYPMRPFTAFYTKIITRLINALMEISVLYCHTLAKVKLFRKYSKNNEEYQKHIGIHRYENEFPKK